jgi:hypothetical protein
MSCIDLLFQKGSVKQIHPKGIDVDSRGPSEYGGSKAKSRPWSHRSPEGQMPIVTRQRSLMAGARGKDSHTRGAERPLVGGHAILTSYCKVSCRSYVYYGIIHTVYQYPRSSLAKTDNGLLIS